MNRNWPLYLNNFSQIAVINPNIGYVRLNMTPLCEPMIQDEMFRLESSNIFEKMFPSDPNNDIVAESKALLISDVSLNLKPTSSFRMLSSISFHQHEEILLGFTTRQNIFDYIKEQLLSLKNVSHCPSWHTAIVDEVIRLS